jgi:hypothetical protein
MCAKNKTAKKFHCSVARDQSWVCRSRAEDRKAAHKGVMPALARRLRRQRCFPIRLRCNRAWDLGATFANSMGGQQNLARIRTGARGRC